MPFSFYPNHEHNCPNVSHHERPGPSNTQQPGLGDALTATAEEATAATIAAKALAGAEAIAEIAFALASQAWVQVTAAADLTFANSSIDASLTHRITRWMPCMRMWWRR